MIIAPKIKFPPKELDKLHTVSSDRIYVCVNGTLLDDRGFETPSTGIRVFYKGSAPKTPATVIQSFLAKKLESLGVSVHIHHLIYGTCMWCMSRSHWNGGCVGNITGPARSMYAGVEDQVYYDDGSSVYIYLPAKIRNKPPLANAVVKTIMIGFETSGKIDRGASKKKVTKKTTKSKAKKGILANV